MRKPAAIGFYPPDRNFLEREVRTLLADIKHLDVEDAVGAIVPHAGYSFSGLTAAAVYASLPEDYETIVILGTNHTGIGASIAVSLDSWQTPLGAVENDVETGKKIVELSKAALHNEAAHMQEHSIEVQLPFLQAKMQDFKIVPITVSSGLSAKTYAELANAIKEAVRGKRALVIASSDFTHYGEMYGFAPECDDANKWVHDTDKKVIEAILAHDTEKFIDLAGKTTVCGAGAIATLMYFTKDRKGKLVDYRTSFDISGDKDLIVGYGGVLFL